jgi:hypothetical protein
MPPKLNRKRALFVLTKIDEILAWEKRKEAEKDTRFVELGRYLCEVRAGQYWRLENLKSFDEFLERRFRESRRKAYYLMSIHEHLPPEVKRELKQVGWTKGLELAKLARSRNGQGFNCAIWLHKARALPPQEFQREVEKELTGHDSEPWEIMYFKLYRSQIPVIEQAIETAALMLGSDKSRGYCLEMICADFLAGANLDGGDPHTLLHSMSRFFQFLSGEQRQAFAREVAGGSCKCLIRLDPSGCDCISIANSTTSCGRKFCGVTAGDANRAARDQIWRFTTRNFAAIAVMTPNRT